MSFDSLCILIVIFFADLVIILGCVNCWRKARRANPSLRLHVHLIELWAATIAFSPTLVFFALAYSEPVSNRWMGWFSVGIIGPHQLAGMFLVILGNSSHPREEKQSTFDLFTEMVAGVLFGLFLTFFSLAVVFGVVAILWILRAYPLALIGFILLALFYFRYRVCSPTIPTAVNADLLWPPTSPTANPSHDPD